MEKKVSDQAARRLFRRERDGEFPEQTPESAAFGPVPFYDGFGAVFPVIPPESFPLRRPLRRGLQTGLQTETDVAAAAVQAFPDPLKEFEAAAGMDEKQLVDCVLITKENADYILKYYQQRARVSLQDEGAMSLDILPDGYAEFADNIKQLLQPVYPQDHGIRVNSGSVCIGIHILCMACHRPQANHCR